MYERRGVSLAVTGRQGHPYLCGKGGKHHFSIGKEGSSPGYVGEEERIPNNGGEKGSIGAVSLTM